VTPGPVEGSAVQPASTRAKTFRFAGFEMKSFIPWLRQSSIPVMVMIGVWRTPPSRRRISVVAARPSCRACDSPPGRHRQVGGWAGQDGAVSASASTELPSYRGYRYPAEIISHAVWLYFRFSLSLRDVEELLAERGVTVTYETIRAWCAKFGPSYAAALRRRRARPSDKWQLDEVQLKIKGKRHWLWRAVDGHGVVLDVLVRQRRDQCAAETFLRRVLAAVGAEPRVVITDKLAS
jgi:hypothetical protein